MHVQNALVASAAIASISLVAQAREGQGVEGVEEDLARGAEGWGRDTSRSNSTFGEVDGFMKVML